MTATRMGARTAPLRSRRWPNWRARRSRPRASGGPPRVHPVRPARRRGGRVRALVRAGAALGARLMTEMLDPYRVLGVARGATKAQIKAAHRTLAKRLSPRRGDRRRAPIPRCAEAYQLLADPLRRREWDARHAPGPVRADDAAAAPRATRRRRPAGRQPDDSADRADLPLVGQRGAVVGGRRSLREPATARRAKAAHERRARRAAARGR